MVAAFTYSIIAAIAVLYRISSVSVVTRRKHSCSAFICSRVGSAPESGAAVKSRHVRERNRETPSTPRVLHTLVSRSGPMNIS